MHLAGKICVLDIDMQGVRSIKKTDLEPLYVFIKPPTIEELVSKEHLQLPMLSMVLYLVDLITSYGIIIYMACLLCWSITGNTILYYNCITVSVCVILYLALALVLVPHSMM